MGFRFRRSVKIAPGLKLNVGKKSVSIRAGGRGLGFTSGTEGSRVSAGIPETGVGYTKKLGRRDPDDPSTPRRRSLLVRMFTGFLQIEVVLLSLLTKFLRRS